MRIQKYTAWEDAARASRSGKAISAYFITIVIPRGTYKIDLVKSLSGDAHAVYHSAPGIKVHDWKPSTADVDRVREWKAF